MKRKNMTVSARTTRRALGMNILSLLLCVSMLIGTTFAWFTDSVTSGRNQIIAGNLDVEVYHQSASVTTPTSIDAQTNLFQDNDGKDMLWEPGAMSYETFTVKNVGDMAFKYNLAMNILDYNAISTDTNKTLKDVLKVLVLTGNDIIAAPTRELVAAKFAAATETKTIADFNKDGGVLFGKDSGKTIEEKFQVLVYWAPTDNDNTYNINNGKTTTDGKRLFITFGVNVIASQYTEESDSFDNQYDVGIVLPDLPVSVNKTFESAAIKTETVTESVAVKNKSTSEGVATVPAAAVNKVIETLVSQATDKATDSDLSTVIYLDVKTTEKTEASVTYEIDLSAKLTYKDTTGAEKTTALADLDGKLADQIVTATMSIGKGLSNVLVKHSGTAMTALTAASSNKEGFFYDKSSGVLTIKSKSFSPFQVSYDFDAEACIGNTVYATIAEALAAAKDGDTVVLLKDITAKTSIQVNENKNVSINLNGKTVECTDKFSDTIKVTGYLNSVYGGTLKGARPVHVDGKDAHLGEIRDCTVVGTGTSYGALWINGACDNITNVTVLGTCSEVVAIQGIYHTGNTIVSGLKSTATCSNWLLINNGAIEINNATISSGGYDVSSPGTVTIKGGTYAVDPSAYVATGYRVEEASGAYTVEYGFAAIGENCYASLADAITAAKTGETIKMLADTEYTDVYFELNGINLDLNNHKIKVTRTGRTRSFDLFGDVTISNGSIEASLLKDNNCAIYGNQGSNVIMKDVNVKAYRTSDGAVAYGPVPFGGYMDNPNGNLVIDGGVYDCNLSTNGSTRYGSVTIKDGTFNGDVYMAAYMTYTISGGTFNKSVEFRSGNITISGGEFKNTGTPVYLNTEQDISIGGCSVGLVSHNGTIAVEGYGPNPVLTITGGTFAGKIGLYRHDASYAYPTVTKPEGSTIETVELGIDPPASGSVTIATADYDKYASFNVGDRQFVYGKGYGNAVDGTMTITLTEATATGADVISVTTSSGTEYYTLSVTGMVQANGEGDPNFNLLICGADVQSASLSGSTYGDSGYGYGTTWDYGTYSGYMIGAVCRN